MTITIGRDTKTSKLSIICDGKRYVCRSVNDVPPSVSQNHCKMEVEKNSVKVTNLDINCDTFINGQPIEIKTINRGDKIELGSDRYHLEWKYIDEVIPPIADIRHLERIWTEYDAHRVDQQIADRRFNSLRSATGLITMGAIVFSMLTGRQSLWLILFYIVAILVSLAFTIKAYKDASAIPQKLQLRSKQFQREYVCPHCGHFLGNQPYEILCQNDRCPYCKTNFIH